MSEEVKSLDEPIKTVFPRNRERVSSVHTKSFKKGQMNLALEWFKERIEEIESEDEVVENFSVATWSGNIDCTISYSYTYQPELD